MRDPEGRVGVGLNVPRIDKTAREVVEDAKAPPGPREWQDFIVRPTPKGTFGEELRALVNRYSMENASNTPDFILAGLLAGLLDIFAGAIRARDGWYGISPRPGQPLRYTNPPVPTGPIVTRTQDMLAALAAKVAQLERELEDVRLREDSGT